MTDDLVVRAVIVAAVGLAALVVALVARRGVAVVRRRVSLTRYGPGIYLFTSATCVSCAAMRAALADRSDVVEVSYEEAGPEFPPEVSRVPAVAVLDERGDGWMAFGMVGRARLDRWLGGP